MCAGSADAASQHTVAPSGSAASCCNPSLSVHTGQRLHQAQSKTSLAQHMRWIAHVQLHAGEEDHVNFHLGRATNIMQMQKTLGTTDVSRTIAPGRCRHVPGQAVCSTPHRCCARSSLSVAQLLPLLQLATSCAAAEVRASARELLGGRLRATGMFEDCPWEPSLWLAALPNEPRSALSQDTRRADVTPCTRSTTLMCLCSRCGCHRNLRRKPA
jgi:hypothetical protein